MFSDDENKRSYQKWQFEFPSMVENAACQALSLPQTQLGSESGVGRVTIAPA